MADGIEDVVAEPARPKLNYPFETVPTVGTAQAVDNVPLVYRFSVGPTPSGPFVAARDFSPKNTFTMAPLYQGTYNVPSVGAFQLRPSTTKGQLSSLGRFLELTFAQLADTTRDYQEETGLH